MRMNLTRGAHLLLSLRAIALLILGAMTISGLVILLPPEYLFVGVGALTLGGLAILRPDWIVIGLALLKASVDNLSQTITLFEGTSYQVNTNGLLNVAVVLLATYFVLTDQVQPLRFSVVKSFAVLLVICATGLIISTEPVSVLREWIRMASLPAVFLLVIAGNRRRSLSRRLRIAILLSSIAPILTGFYQVVTGKGYTITPGFNRAQGTFWFPNGLAFYLLIVLMLLLSTYQMSRSMLWRIGLLGLGAACGVMLVLTYTRAAWVGLILAVSVVAATRYRRWLVIIPILLLIAVATPSVQRRMADLFTPQTLSLERGQVVESSSLGAVNSFQWRLLLWSDTFKFVTMLGNGLGSFPTLAAITPIGARIGAHNDYLRIAVEVGVLGLIVYLWVHWRVIRVAWRKFKNTKEKERLTALSFVGLYLAMLAISFTDNLLSYHTVGWYLWMYMALVHLEKPGFSQNGSGENG